MSVPPNILILNQPIPVHLAHPYLALLLGPREVGAHAEELRDGVERLGVPVRLLAQVDLDERKAKARNPPDQVEQPAVQVPNEWPATIHHCEHAGATRWFDLGTHTYPRAIRASPHSISER